MHARVVVATFVASPLVFALACGEPESPGDDEVGGTSETAGESETESGDATQACVPGETQACECEDGFVGEQTCMPDGSGFGACESCMDPDPPVCGDMQCEAEAEDCSSCPEDCGICLDCEEAPSCEAAAIPGAIDVHLEALDVPLPGGDAAPLELAPRLQEAIEQGQLGVRVVAAALADAEPGEHPFVPRLRAVFAEHPHEAALVRRGLARAGMAAPASYRQHFPLAPALVDELAPPPAGAPEDCEDPQLRIRVAKIVVHEEADLVWKDNIYCAIISEATQSAEIRVTPKTYALDTGEEYVYSLAEGVVWGQLGEPVAPQGNLLLTYNCLEADDTGGFEEFLDAIADAALGADAIPGAYGWVIPVIGLAAEIIGSALALETDNHLFNASQVVPAELQLGMTTGVWWSVQREGTFNLKPWHWELRMEAWGCTADGVLR